MIDPNNSFLKICLCVFLPFAIHSSTLQDQADALRESGHSLEAIDAYNHAIVELQANHDYVSLIGSLTGRLLCWKHLFYQTEDKVYALFVKNEAQAISDIMSEYALVDSLHLSHFLLATSALLLDDTLTAEQQFRKAVELYPTDHAERGDWTAHLGHAMYCNGQKDAGKEMILQGVQMIETHADQIDSFLFNVWVSGAYLRLAKLLQPDNLADSLFYLAKAKAIIDGDDRLVIRKQQLDAFWSR